MSENIIENFCPVELTKQGEELLAKVQTGIPLNITRAGVGDGFVSDGQSVTQLMSLVNEIPSHASKISGTSTVVDITYHKAESNSTVLRIRVQNGDTEFDLREIGIFAQDPDLGEILYAYTNCGNGALTMPVYNGKTRTVRDYTLATRIGNASDLEVNVTLPAEVRQEEFDAHANNQSIHWQISLSSEEPKGNNYIWFVPYTPQESIQEVVLQSVDYNGDETKLHVDMDGEINTADNTAVSDEYGEKVILFE